MEAIIKRAVLCRSLNERERSRRLTLTPLALPESVKHRETSRVQLDNEGRKGG